MRSRINILKDIVSFSGILKNLEKELSFYEWDSEVELIEIHKIDLLNGIEKYFKDEINKQDLIMWFNLIECRDDIKFNSDVIQEVIHELANPEINGGISRDRLEIIVKQLRNGACGV